MDLFDLPVNGSFINFEKSANYFYHPEIIKRIKTMYKDIQLVAFLMNPIDRAYSFYQVCWLCASYYCFLYFHFLASSW